ncbi:enterobactin transporter EntS [Cellulosimicrobium protaetiae]|uniref:Enterobactin transporter EntS n=1 Tax=Cellulosimicrobium protaetiae TaxID=2587808 RepID=A0A6M5UEV2_9MICO|nr:enterobactin transporter EntS [Cellulosimicrobium protaetiae]QJW35861.1 enterobactin transporter EntS [Cellulosimicrobium protaetiae]
MRGPGALLAAIALDVSPLRESRSFRQLFEGRVVSLLGLGMLVVALPVQVYALTGSSLHVAGVNTTLGVTAFAGTLAAGVVADRVDRRRVILWSRSAAVLGFVALLVNSLVETPSLPVIYVVAAWDGLAGGFSVVALAAAVPSLVPPGRLPAVAALQAISLDVGAVVSPLLAGVAVAHGGSALVYAVVVATSVVSLGLLVRLPPLPPGGSDDPDDEPVPVRPWADLVEGVRHVARDRVVGGIVLLGFVQILFASPHVLIPELVDTQLGAGPEVVGLLYSAPAAGALVATLTSGWTGRVRRTGRLLLVVLAASGAGIVVLGTSQSVALAVVAMTLVGVGDVLGEILRFTLLYEHTPDHLRGRVSALWTAQGTAGDALGGPLLTLLARALGPGGAIALGGALAVVATGLVALLVPGLRRAVTEPPPADDVPHPDPPAPDPVPEPADATVGSTRGENA